MAERQGRSGARVMFKSLDEKVLDDDGVFRTRWYLVQHTIHNH